ncbi:3-phosphoshikimate 1-carboxyvinyltransferase, partial [Alphaproteobacteria bacterium]|nr:3-phosphoshikimate 1-carboxyvinyltransferase [Alphaproteobacteria bacterium]
MNSIISSKSSNLSGEMMVPGDKSISHRSLIIGSTVTGKISINNLLESEDVLATANALRTMGITINKLSYQKWEVFGNGIGSLSGNNNVLDMGNSGTGARLLMGLVAGSDVEATFIGDESLSKRPMKRITSPLIQSGAVIESLNNDSLPIKIKGSKITLPIEYQSKISSAQVKSSILLAGLSSLGTTTFIEPSLSRDHTERMLTFFGAKVETTQLKNSTWKITLDGIPTLQPLDINVPSDPSSASFPIVSALITPNSTIKVMNICINELRTGLYKTLIEMGANIKFTNSREVNGELVADITAKSSKLKGITVPKSRAASMIDEYPILAIAAIKAEGDTIMEGIEELRYKETDRIKAVCEGLNKLGIETIEAQDSMIVKGKGSKTKINGNVEIQSNLDHRIAMCFLCLGLISENPIKVKDTDTINSSFPFFLDKMKG